MIATYNPSTNAWVCRVPDPMHDWTAVFVDGVWYNEIAQSEIENPEVLDMLDAAVERAKMAADGEPIGNACIRCGGSIADNRETCGALECGLGELPR